MLDKRDPVYGRLAVLVVGRLEVALGINAPQPGHIVAVFAEALEEVELLGEDLSQNIELVETDEVGAHERDGLVALPLVVAALFLGGCQSAPSLQGVCVFRVSWQRKREERRSRERE